MMPSVDGISLCLQLRKETDVPVLFVSAKSDPPDRVVGLRIGADDYMGKPFDNNELVARVEALLRRRSYAAVADRDRRQLRFGMFVIDLGSVQAIHGDSALPLTPTEFKLLKTLGGEPGRVFTRDDLLTHYPLRGLEQRVHVVPVGSGLEHVEPGPLPEGLAPGFLLAVGTIEPRKNYPRLLEAYRRLKRRGVEVPLVVAGRVGWAYGSALDDLRREPGVRLLGHVDDPTLRALYQSAGALALPSLYEGFGLPLLEAMGEGLPAVVGAAGALPALAGDAALLIDPTDVVAIADGLQLVLEDGEVRRRLAAAGRERAGRYSWRAAAQTTWRILDGLA